MENTSLCQQVLDDMERVVRNCQFYLDEGNKTHLLNEVGCLRGQMYIADMIGLQYPKMEYYEKWIKPIHDIMKG